MLRQSPYTEQFTFFQKLRSFDYVLLSCILILGFVSNLSMYSTDGGEFLYHSKSHFIRFVVFFTMMIFLSFLNLRFWHSTAYFFYIIVLGFLIWASIHGVTASGSQRWINLYFINLQPSELMKIAIIVCFARYFHRTQLSSIGSFKNMVISFMILIMPIFLVLSQPDLGTSILIGMSGIVVLWLAGLSIKYFVYSSLGLLISLPFVIKLLSSGQIIIIGKNPI